MTPALGWPCWIGVVTADLARQRQFYREILGFRELAEGPGWVQFDLGDARLLELVQRTDQPQYDEARYQAGFAVEDIEAARDQLIARGVRPVSDLQGEASGGGRWCYFLDAEDNVFELKERRPAPA
jgi:catechol 2,3-dioxygenase-like lactoylglutathione lyase family enzyme